MKAKSIVLIREVLIYQRGKAFSKYQNIKDTLQTKYDTVWLDSVATKSELKDLRTIKEAYECLDELLQDFENHQW